MRYQEYRVLTDIHSDTITRVAFNEDGKLLASSSLDGNLCVWDMKTGLLCYQYFTGHGVLSIVWADLERILCGLNDGSIACLVINSETKSLDVTGTWGHSYPVEALAVSKNRLASGAHKELFIWRWNYNVMSYQEREVSLPEQSALEPDEEAPVVTALHWAGRDGGGSPTLLIVGYISHGIRIFETQRWGEVRHIPAGGPLGPASVSPDSKYIAVSNVFTGFHVYRLDNGDSVAHFEQEEVSQARPLPVAWLHGGRAILGGSTTGSINIWYIDTGRKVVCLPVPQSSKTLAIAAHYNSEHNKHAFLVACGTETEDHKICIIAWKAEQRKVHESKAGSEDDEDSESESNTEPEQVATIDRSVVWPFSGAGIITIIGLLVALRLVGVDLPGLGGL